MQANRRKTWAFFFCFVMHKCILSRFSSLIVTHNCKHFEGITKLCTFKYIVEFLGLTRFRVDINLKRALSTYYERTMVNKTRYYL